MSQDNSFKLGALDLSDEIGVRKDAEQLGIPYYTMSEWRQQRKTKGEYVFIGSGNKSLSASEKYRRILRIPEVDEFATKKKKQSDETQLIDRLTRFHACREK